MEISKDELKKETSKNIYDAKLYELAKLIGIISEEIKTRKIADAYRNLLGTEKIYLEMNEEERKKFSNRFKKDLLSFAAELELAKEERRVRVEDVSEIEEDEKKEKKESNDLGEIQKKLDEMIKNIK